MIHFHGGPITPIEAAVALWKSRHAMVSFEHPFEHPGQVALAFEVCQSVRLDNSAFSKWLKWRKARSEAGMEHNPNWEPTKRLIDIPAYAAWVREWERHPAYDGAMIPDDIEGNEEANNKLIAQWLQQLPRVSGGIPVWHLHESTERLQYLIQCAGGACIRRSPSVPVESGRTPGPRTGGIAWTTP